jgi:hypothetical protein
VINGAGTASISAIVADLVDDDSSVVRAAVV